MDDAHSIDDAGISKRKLRQKERFEAIKNKSKEKREAIAEQAYVPRSDSKIAYQAEIFANRIKKRRTHLLKWARRSGVSCFRIYDHDIPELPFQVDEYEKHLVLYYLVKSDANTLEQDEAWLTAISAKISNELSIPLESLHIKKRFQQKGNTQYTKTEAAPCIIIAKENSLSFEVNLSNYVDTGLFLDHRTTRAMVRQLSLGADVLNLFSYTGSFSVYAASGGAKSTTSVDMSQTYCEWAKRNLMLNNFQTANHQLIQADIIQWLPIAITKSQKYDVIVVDPPTFSNSKSMIGHFDIQNDYPYIINHCLQLLQPKGIIIFSNNYHKFKIDSTLINATSIEEISSKTIPEDFSGKKPHCSWIIR